MGACFWLLSPLQTGARVTSLSRLPCTPLPIPRGIGPVFAVQLSYGTPSCRAPFPAVPPPKSWCRKGGGDLFLPSLAARQGDDVLRPPKLLVAWHQSRPARALSRLPSPSLLFYRVAKVERLCSFVGLPLRLPPLPPPPLSPSLSAAPSIRLSACAPCPSVGTCSSYPIHGIPSAHSSVTRSPPRAPAGSRRRCITCAVLASRPKGTKCRWD